MMLLEISIHASREGSDLVLLATIAIATISIHASREGSDLKSGALTASSMISIHASREGSDIERSVAAPLVRNFNPRFPQGKRQWTPRFSFCGCLFQSTLPAREATSILT